MEEDGEEEEVRAFLRDAQRIPNTGSCSKQLKPSLRRQTAWQRRHIMMMPPLDYLRRSTMRRTCTGRFLRLRIRMEPRLRICPWTLRKMVLCRLVSLRVTLAETPMQRQVFSLSLSLSLSLSRARARSLSVQANPTVYIKTYTYTHVDLNIIRKTYTYTYMVLIGIENVHIHTHGPEYYA